MKWILLVLIVIAGQALNSMAFNIESDVWLIAYGIFIGQTASGAMQLCNYLAKRD